MRNSLPTEVLLAAGFSGTREYGTAANTRWAAEDRLKSLDAESTWLEVLVAHLSVVQSQEDPQCLRTALVALAGRTVAAIRQLDEEEASAA